VIFCRQLATLLSAGVTILKSLDIISKQIASRKFYNVIKELEKNMEAGTSLYEAMSKHPKVFSELWVNLVESGEASGNLAVVLGRLASYFERDAAFKRKLISSLMYPVVLAIAGIGALLFLTIRIIPTFADLFKGFNITLPLLTRILMVISDFIRRYILIIIGMLIVGFFILRQYVHTKGGRRKFERLQFSLPIFGEFFRALVVEKFSSGMSTLIESGVPLLYSLEITEHSVDNVMMADIVRRIKEDVREGRPLSNTLEKSEFFEPMVVQMVAIGEEIGELPQMLKRIDSFYQEYVETFLTRLTSMFEPIMLLFMGLVIGAMVVGMFLPIFKIATMGSTR
jgi:type IV pilus assembly protein PilC